jgi:hypothetical protein
MNTFRAFHDVNARRGTTRIACRACCDAFCDSFSCSTFESASAHAHTHTHTRLTSLQHRRNTSLRLHASTFTRARARCTCVQLRTWLCTQCTARATSCRSLWCCCARAHRSTSRSATSAGTHARVLRRRASLRAIAVAQRRACSQLRCCTRKRSAPQQSLRIS